MAIEIEFTDKDWKNIPSASGLSTDINTFNGTAVNLVIGTGNPASHLIGSLAGTSPATFDGTRRWLGFEIEIKEPDGSGAGANITTLKIPVLFWKASETSTAKQTSQAVTIPLMALKRNCNVSVKVISGNDDDTYTSVESNVQLLSTIAW